jgi:hypothetical protein
MATWQNNGQEDADTLPPPPAADDPVHEERLRITVAEAVIWASSFSCPVTLFLRDATRSQSSWSRMTQGHR